MNPLRIIPRNFTQRLVHNYNEAIDKATLAQMEAMRDTIKVGLPQDKALVALRRLEARERALRAARVLG
jgi:hypothetical protein